MSLLRQPAAPEAVMPTYPKSAAHWVPSASFQNCEIRHVRAGSGIVHACTHTDLANDRWLYLCARTPDTKMVPFRMRNGSCSSPITCLVCIAVMP